MQITNDTKQVEASAVDRFSWRQLRSWALAAVMAGLVALNLMTLTNESVHESLYDGLHRVLGSVVQEKAMEALLASSPTAKRRKDVERATKAIMGEKDAIAASKKALELQHGQLQKQHGDLKNKHAELNRVSANRAAVSKRVSSRIFSRIAKFAPTKASSVLAEAIPVAGVVVLLGVEVLDVYYECQTLKDLAELDAAFDLTPADTAKVCGISIPSQEQVANMLKGNTKEILDSTMKTLKQAQADKSLDTR